MRRVEPDADSFTTFASGAGVRTARSIRVGAASGGRRDDHQGDEGCERQTHVRRSVTTRPYNRDMRLLDSRCWLAALLAAPAGAAETKYSIANGCFDVDRRARRGRTA